MAEAVEQHDILILGAGLSGINTAHILREKLPGRKITILEARSIIGGTWSFFRYPGFRSDSEMTIFGLQWHRWPHLHRIATGEEIRAYLEEAVDADGLRDLIQFRHRVQEASWSSEEHKWSLKVDADGTLKHLEANFVVACTGYYAYDRVQEVVIPGLDTFSGEVVHPHWWPEDFDYTDKRIVIVGSGATTITLLPSLAEKAGHVTMLQRSPSFVIPVPMYASYDRILRRLLPLRWQQFISCWTDIILETIVTQLMLAFPSLGRKLVTWEAKKVAPPDVDVDVHFNARYNVLQQRLGFSPEGDFFKALGQDNCEIVTDIIKTVTPDGVELESGRKLSADIIITATGLYVQLLGGIKVFVDGEALDVGTKYCWRGGMVEGLPNMAFIIGYVTQTWTPGATTMANIMVRVLKHMKKTASTKVVPFIERTPGMPSLLSVSATSRYLVSAGDRIPKITGKGVWRGRSNLIVDMVALLFGNVTEGLIYTRSEKDKTA